MMLLACLISFRVHCVFPHPVGPETMAVNGCVNKIDIITKEELERDSNPGSYDPS
jgi:hypothetical protein